MSLPGICLDASVLIAHFNPGDAHHRGATQILAEHADSQFHASTLTLAEFYAQPAKAGAEALGVAKAGIAALRVTAVPVADPERLAGLRATTGLKMPDCCVLDAALSGPRPGAMPVATFDTALRLAAHHLGLPVIVPDTSP